MLIGTSKSGYIGGDHLIQGNEFSYTGNYLTEPYKPGVNTIYNPGNRTIVENNVFHHIFHGVGIWTTNVMIRGVIVRNNLFHDVGRLSLNPYQAGSNGYTGIHVSSGGGDHHIYNNVFYRSGETPSFGAIVVKPYFGQSDTLPVHIYNNTIYDILNPSAPAILVLPNSGGPHLVKNNIAYMAGKGIVGGAQSNNLTDDPSFMDPAGGDFSLQSLSAAIDEGEALDIVKTDFRGVLRPQGAGYDIGAYEWCSEESCGSGEGTGTGAGPGSGSTSNGGTGSAGNGAGSTSGGAPSGAGGMQGGLGGQDGNGDPAEDGDMVGSCSCSVGAGGGSRGLGILSVASLAWLVSRRRRVRV